MTYEDFDLCVEDLVAHMGQAAERFLRTKGIPKLDWLAFWKQASTDHATAAREILFFAADVWPETANDEVKKRTAA